MSSDLVRRLRDTAVPTVELCDDAADEIELLREAIRRIAEQDATLSVQGGNVIVEMDATLTEEEREAIDEAADTSDVAAEFYSGKDHARADAAAKHAATLRGLIDRTQTVKE